ncbi:MAG: hypothetical protein ACI94O_001623, partial [Octadecabacter sp.]
WPTEWRQPVTGKISHLPTSALLLRRNQCCDRGEGLVSTLDLEMCIMQHWSRLTFLLPFTQREIKMRGVAM